MPFLEETPRGRIVLNITSLLVLVAGAGAISRSAGSILISVLLAVPTAAFLLPAIGYGQSQLQILSQAFGTRSISR